MANYYTRGRTIWVHYSIDGKLYQRSLKIKDTPYNRKLARKKVTEIEDIIENNGVITDDDIAIGRKSSKDENREHIKKIKVSELIDNFLLTKYFKPKNLKMYKLAFKKWFEFNKDTPILLVTPPACERYKNRLLNNVAYESARTYLNYFHIFMSYVVKLGYYQKENPVKKLKAREKNYIRTIPENEMKIILKYLQKNNLEVFRFVKFLYLTGFRLSEGLGLTWEQIKFDENIIVVTTYKDNERQDLHPLNVEPELKKFLLSFRKVSGKVFELQKDYPLKAFQNAISNINETNKKEYKIPRYTIHDIRRTYATKYAPKLLGVYLQQLMRHKQFITTQKYYIKTDILKIVDQLDSGNTTKKLPK